MVYKNQSGQVLIEAAFVFLFFSCILLIFQAMLDQQKARSNKYKLSKEVRSEINSTNYPITQTK